MKPTFGKKEGTFVILNILGSQIFLNMPRFVSEIAGTAGWILVIYVSMLAFLLFLILIRLYKNFWGMDLIDISQDVFGNVGRIITGMTFFMIWSFYLTLILRQFAENIKIIGLTNTPISFIQFFFLAGVIAAAYAGIEPISRVTSLTVPFIMAAAIIMLVASIPNCNSENIFPIFGNGLNTLFGKGSSFISIYFGITLILFFAPNLQSYKNTKKVGRNAVLLAAGFLLAFTAVYQMVYPYPTSTENFLPIYQMTRAVSLGRFLERIEAVFLPVWTLVAFLIMSVVSTVSLKILQKTLKLNSYKPLIPVYAVLLFCVSLLPANLMTVIDLELKIIRTFGIPAEAGLTLIILAGGIIKKKLKGKQKNEINDPGV